jgi:peptidoglycan hydrolase-like protein with peptidoglycan-binding domain
MFGLVRRRSGTGQVTAAPVREVRIEGGAARGPGSRRWVLVTAGAAALLSVGGLVGASFVQSPEQQRASALPPPRSVLTAVVEQRKLASTVVGRGQVGPERRVEATPATAQGASVAVVTAVRSGVGAKVRAGDVVLTVSGRPLLILPGAVPGYRDLKPGDEGGDVAQLQAALRQLGHYRSGDRRGYFGPATKTAVRKLYSAIGYQVPDTGGPGGQQDRAARRAAEDAVTAAQAAVASLTARLAADVQPSPEPGEPGLREQLKTARRTLARARQDQRDLIARTGPMVPLGEVVFLPSLPATVAALGGKVGDPVEAPLITFATGRLNVTATLQPEQAALLRPGMPVEVLSETLQKKVTGVVSVIGKLTTDQEGQSGQEGQEGQGTQGGQPGGLPYVPVTVTTTRPLDNQWNGLDVRLTVTAGQTSGDVLVVPVSAVSAAANGSTTVTVLGPSGTQLRVPVQPGVSGDGFVAVTPVGDAALTPGDQVVIGQ